uniref:Scavenger receptor class B member 1 n=1 Tax=Steinernema glaseri TaxID=37863 RepID=A0A1I7ZL78_9BILA
MRLCLKVLVGLLLAALLVLGLILLIAFPLGIFPAVLKQRLLLSADNGTVSSYWGRLPMDSHFDFYLFNTTNPDEIEFFGMQASVQEVGPYSFKETEVKESLMWMNSGQEVFYKNNKTWIYDPAASCKKCTYLDEFVLPNAVYMAVSNLEKLHQINEIQRLLLDASLLALGEYPYRKVSMRGVLFEAYRDPMVDLMHSDFFKKDLPEFFNKTSMDELLGFPMPNLKYPGYFPRYNMTNDETYVVKTGKDDANDLNAIVSWAGSPKLQWWGDDRANDLRGATDGSFNKPFPKKSDTYRIFRSLTCRTFDMHYEGDKTVSGVDGYVFRISADSYNTTLPHNRGYLFNNTFNKNYFPDWPCQGKPIAAPSNETDCSAVQCNQPQNYCTPCCHGSLIRGNVHMPPGLVALKCFPGHNQSMVIPAAISPPHFVDSPPQVAASVLGLNPVRSKHNVGHFTLNKYTGNTIDARFRVQLSIPVYQDDDLTSLKNMRSSMIPCFWLEVRVSLLQYAIDYLHTNTSVVPKAILGVGIGITALACILGTLFVFCLVRSHRRRSKTSQFDFSKPVSHPKSWSPASSERVSQY